MQVDIVLVEPQTSGNIGAVARVMKNFDFDNLILIDPECELDDYDAKARAMHAKEDVLQNARVEEWNYLDNYDYRVATTAILGDEHNMKRNPLTPEELSHRVKVTEGKKMAILFGREDLGLSNEEILRCDFVVNIPANPEYSTMNLSHAVAVILYELYRAMNEENFGKDIEPIGREEKEVMLDVIDEVLDEMEFQTEHKREQQKRLWRRIIGKSMLSNREAHALIGMFKKFKD